MYKKVTFMYIFVNIIKPQPSAPALLLSETSPVWRAGIWNERGKHRPRILSRLEPLGSPDVHDTRSDQKGNILFGL